MVVLSWTLSSTFDIGKIRCWKNCSVSATTSFLVVMNCGLLPSGTDTEELPRLLSPSKGRWMDGHGYLHQVGRPAMQGHDSSKHSISTA